MSSTPSNPDSGGAAAPDPARPGPAPGAPHPNPHPHRRPPTRPIGPAVIDPMALDVSEEEPVSAAPVELVDHAGRPHVPHEPTVAPVRDGEIRSGRLAGLSMGAAIFTLAWPILCESMLNSTVGLVDTWLAAHISQAATDAVGAAAYIQWFVGLITMAIGVGATALVSRSIGAGKMAVAKAALGQAVLLASIGGVLVGVLMAALAAPMADLTSLHGEAARDFRAFLWAYCIGAPFSTILFACTACARGAGDTLRPLWTMVVVNLVNFCAAYTLVRVAGLGVRGIGFGTATAHAVGAGLILWFHARGASGVRLTLSRLKPHLVTIWRLVRLGLPNFFETLGMWVVNFGVLLMVGWMGDAALRAAAAGSPVVGDSSGMQGAHLWAIRVEAFSFLPGFSMGVAAGALAGQYLGAGSPTKARRSVLICAAAAAAIMGTLGLVFIFLGGPIMHLLSEQPAHRELTPRLLFITGLVQVPFALSIVLRSAMHGAGDVRAVMVMTWISQWGLRLPLAYAISGVDVPLPQWLGGGVIDNPFPFDLGLPGLWIGLTAEIVIRALIYGWRFSSGKWLTARV